MVFNTTWGRKCNDMKKLLFIILLLPFLAQAQTTYQLNYDSIRVNKTAGTGGTSLYGKVYLKNVTARSVGDSILTVVNGRIFKVPYTAPTTQFWQRSGTTLSPLTSGDNISTTGNITGAVGTFESSGSGNTLVVNHTSGAGAAINITKGGNGEGLYVNKTSGSGNAATIIGTLNATDMVTGGLSAASVASTASNGVSGGFTNNATSFESLRATNNGSGLIASFRNSGGEVASIGNSGIITLADEAYSSSWNGKLEAPTKNAIWDAGFLTSDSGVVLTTTNQSISGVKTFNDQILTNTSSAPSAIQAASTNSGGRVITLLGNSILEPLAVVQQGSGKLSAFGTSDGMTYVDKALIRNDGSIYTRGQLEVGNLLVGDAADSVMVHRAIDLTVRRVPTTGTGSAVFSASPTFTGTVSGADGHFSGSFGIGISPTYPLHVSKNLSNAYIAQLANTNTTAGTSFGLFMNAGTNSSDRAINVNNAANTITLLASFGNGDLEIGGSNATKASGTAWIPASDRRLKTNIEDYTKGLSDILKINPKSYNFNKASGRDTTKRHVSVMAQDLAQVAPEMVSTFKGKLNGKETDLFQIDVSDLNWMFVNAIKELNAKIEALEARIKVLENKP
jgi:hypothetical protein